MQRHESNVRAWAAAIRGDPALILAKWGGEAGQRAMHQRRAARHSGLGMAGAQRGFGRRQVAPAARSGSPRSLRGLPAVLTKTFSSR